MLFMVYDMHLFSIYWTHLTLFVWSGMRKKGPDGWTCWWWWSCAVLEQVAAAATITQLIIAACPRDPQSVPTVHHQQGRALCHVPYFTCAQLSVVKNLFWPKACKNSQKW